VSIDLKRRISNDALSRGFVNREIAVQEMENAMTQPFCFDRYLKRA